MDEEQRSTPGETKRPGRPARRDVVVVGESLVDVVRQPDGSDVEHAGGSAANVAVALARLGRPVWFATALADDRFGGILAAHLGRDGVRLATEPEVVERTSSAVAVLDEHGAASYTFDLAWRLGPLEPVVEHARASAALHVCSIAAVLPPGADQVTDLLDRVPDDLLVSYDVNARPAITGTGPEVLARVERVAARATVVKASDEDLAACYPDLDTVAAARRLLGLGPAAVVVTRGGAGALWVGAEDDPVAPLLEADPVRVDVVDTIGAGDTFGAALLDGLLDALAAAGSSEAEPRAAVRALDRQAREQVLARATLAGAVAVTRPGADPPYRAELDRAGLDRAGLDRAGRDEAPPGGAD